MIIESELRRWDLYIDTKTVRLMDFIRGTFSLIRNFSRYRNFGSYMVCDEDLNPIFSIGRRIKTIFD